MIKRFKNYLIATEAVMVDWRTKHCLDILRISLGIIFVWFGALKFFHGLSSAEVIAGKTIYKLTFHLIRPTISLPLLACWECLIGLGLITKKQLSFTLLLLYFQMAGTLLPLAFFPHETWTTSLLVPTLLGQYIIKNLVLLSAGIVIGATIHSHQLIKKLEIAKKQISTQHQQV